MLHLRARSNRTTFPTWETILVLAGTLIFATLGLMAHSLWPVVLGVLFLLLLTAYCLPHPTRGRALLNCCVLTLAACASFAFLSQRPYALGMLGFFALATLSRNETVRRFCASPLCISGLTAFSPLLLGGFTFLPSLSVPPHAFGSTLAASLPPIAIALIYHRPCAPRCLLFWGGLGVLLLTQEEHLAFLALFVSYPLLLLPKRLFTLTFWSLLLVLIAVLWAMPWVVKSAHLWLGYSTGTEHWTTLMKRMLHWKELLLWIEKSPWFGWGIGSAPKLSNRLIFVPLRFPHNLFLQLWVEGGVISVCLLTLNLLGGGWLSQAWHNRNHQTLAATRGLLAVGVASLTQGTFHQNLWNPWCWVPFCSACLTVLWRTPLAYAQDRPSPP